MTTPKKPTGRVPVEAIRSMTIPRLPAPILAAFAQIEDLTCTVSDAMDNLGLRGAIAASALAPNLPQARLVGQAVTVRNIEQQEGDHLSAMSGRGRMGEHEGYNLSEPGDVVVIEGLTGVSNMGGQSACDLRDCCCMAHEILTSAGRIPHILLVRHQADRLYMGSANSRAMSLRRSASPTAVTATASTAPNTLA